jgi:hypothetical protein
MNVPYKTRRLGFAGDPRVPFAWAGWNDARDGKPMDYYLIDRAPTVACAQAYETARLRVMALRDAGLPVPRWNSMKAVPPAIHAALSLTNSLQAMARDEGAAYWPTGSKHWREAA